MATTGLAAGLASMVFGGLLLVAPAASAATAATASQTTGLTDGQVVQVSGSGYVPNGPIAVLQCFNADGAGNPLAADAQNCNAGAAVLGTADGSGNVGPVDFTVRESFSTGLNSPKSCIEGGTFDCYLSIRDQVAGAVPGKVAIHFGAASSGPSMTVTPDTGLVDGQEVQVEVTGLPPTVTSIVAFSQCPTTAQHGATAGQPLTLTPTGPSPAGWIPAQCSNAIQGDGTPVTGGAASFEFTVHTGISNSNYPGGQTACGPGSTCQILAIGSTPANSTTTATATISFAGGATTSSTSTSTTSSTSTSSSTTSTSSSSSSTTSTTTPSTTTTTAPVGSGAVVSLSRSTGLVDGDVIEVTVSGLPASVTELVNASTCPTTGTYGAAEGDTLSIGASGLSPAGWLQSFCSNAVQGAGTPVVGGAATFPYTIHTGATNSNYAAAGAAPSCNPGDTCNVVVIGALPPNASNTGLAAFTFAGGGATTSSSSTTSTSVASSTSTTGATATSSTAAASGGQGGGGLLPRTGASPMRLGLSAVLLVVGGTCFVRGRQLLAS